MKFVILIPRIRVRMERLGHQSEVIQTAIEDNLKAQQTLKNLEGIEPGKEALIPVGAGTFIRVNTSEEGKALLSLGRGIWADVGPETALDTLEDRLKELEGSQERLMEGLDSLKEQGAALQSRLEQLSSTGGAPGPGPAIDPAG